MIVLSNKTFYNSMGFERTIVDARRRRPIFHLFFKTIEQNRTNSHQITYSDSFSWKVAVSIPWRQIHEIFFNGPIQASFCFFLSFPHETIHI